MKFWLELVSFTSLYCLDKKNKVYKYFYFGGGQEYIVGSGVVNYQL